MKTAIDLINLTPSILLDGDVRNRVWIGKYACYGYLRVLGCRAFVHIPRYKRSNLDRKSKQIVVNLDSNLHQYKLEYYF